MNKKTTKLLVVALFYSIFGIPELVAQTYLDFLTERMDQYHSVFYVYEDASSAGNHFDYKGALGDFNSGMDANWATSPQSGKTCIRASYNAGSNPGGNGWTGWSMQNGVLLNGTAVPISNWGTYPNAGIDLSGATTLSFWAKGESGGEVVEFSAFGIGRNLLGNPNQPYPGSSPATKTEITLTTTWTEYTLDLTGLDISYVLGGFTWAAASGKNGNQDIVFYIDNIQYDLTRLDEPRFLTSFKTIPSNSDFDLVMSNVAYSYDNALALMSFLMYGDTDRAKLIADAFVYAYHNDRFYDGADNNDGNPFNDDKVLRNAYQSGDLKVANGWVANGKTGTVRMSGWWDPDANGGNGAWYEDLFAASTHTGNVAWPMLALLSYYQTINGDNYIAGDPYLEVIDGLGEWLEDHVKDPNGPGGYIGGMMGWSEWGADPFSSGLPAGPKPLTYKSTEQNLDLYACFQRLENIYATIGGSTGKAGYAGYWQTRADYTRNFVLAMWNNTAKHFWTGTGSDGITIDTSKVATDAQTWTLLALKLDSSYWAAMDYAEINNMYYNNGQPSWGFDFNDKNQIPWYPDAPPDYSGETDGIWFEGTGQAANAYQFIQQEQKANDVINTITTLGQTASGGVNAVYTDLQNGTWELLTSGFESLIASGSATGIDAIPWYYYKREHLAATAWAISSEQRINLFWLGTPDGNIPVAPNNLLVINGAQEPISSYAPGSQDNGDFEIVNNGDDIRLFGNAWKKAPLNYTVTSNTVIDFELKVTNSGEIHGILFDNDNALNGSDSQRLFQLAGIQTWGLQNFRTYSGNDWVSFSIPVGQFFTGDFQYIVFVADKDSNGASQESFFRNVVFTETNSSKFAALGKNDTLNIRETISEIHAVSLYPNEANSSVKLMGKEPIGDIFIYSLTGRLSKKVKSSHNQKLIEIDVSDISNGMYLVVFKSGGSCSNPEA